MKQHRRLASLAAKLMVLLALVGFAAFAADDESPTGVEVKVVRDPMRQLGRGLANVVAGVWEVPYNIYRVKENDGDMAGATYGTIRGVARFVTREVVGVFEVLTFPFGWSPIIEPEFPLQPDPSTDWRFNGAPWRED
jgi:putative exosortase-associated protein (TIGR04073 family)